MTKNVLSVRAALRQKLIHTAFQSAEFKQELEECQSEIYSRCKSATNEATVEGIFERILYGLLKDIGIAFHPEKEQLVETKRHKSFGRIDSRIGALVIEYKHFSKLRTSSQVKAAKKQISEYLQSTSEGQSSVVIGYVTDGLSLFELHAFEGEVTAVSGREKISVQRLLRIVRSIVSLNQSALTAANLIRDFCGNEQNGVLFALARDFNSVLTARPSAKTAMLRSEWEELFRLAHDDQSQQQRIQERRDALSGIFDLTIGDAAEEYQSLFALHTAYAVILKTLAYRVVSDIQFGKPLQEYKSLLRINSSTLRSFFSSLEDGEIFRQLGILNLLEGDFFSWYCDSSQWSADISSRLKEILEILSRYEDVKQVFASSSAIDLFRDLYEAAVPQVVRASFGEFYTPFWLASHVFASSKPPSKWRVLDPCCGSGTFVITAISVLREDSSISRESLLNEITNRVVALDLNPLAVLTTRIHYFIHIADLMTDAVSKLVIPVFLGDSSYVPEEISVSGVSCLKYELKTLKAPISIVFPKSLVKDTEQFVELMYKYEEHVKDKNEETAYDLLFRSLDEADKKEEILSRLHELTSQLVELESKGWNGIWARIITNFLTTACIGEFTNIIGNPPWIDWKNLPGGYRSRVKSLCIEKGLFSGAGRTGGINLNICALITHIACVNWLADEGRLAFLMPRELAYQASYEGWRLSVGGKKRDILGFYDWSKAGHPFDPVKEDFMTYVIGKKTHRFTNVVPVRFFQKRKSVKDTARDWNSLEQALSNLESHDAVAGAIIPGYSIYTIAPSRKRLDQLRLVAGHCEYIGREGIEFYPQELLIFKFVKSGPRKNTVILRNIQVQKSKYKIPEQEVILETEYLYPLVKSPSIHPFEHRYDGLIVPFPYDSSDPKRPLSRESLKASSPLLLKYYLKYEDVIKAQTAFSDKIRGEDAGEYYGLARTGLYSFQKTYVAFRDNSKWRSTVVSNTTVPWGDKRRFLFQNHAVSICEREDGSGMISVDEAHYICAILNAPVVEEFIYRSSDSRSFKIRPPIYVPKFRKTDKLHSKLSALSKQAHKDAAMIDDIRQEIERVYLNLCRKRKEH